jgi:glutathione S-transferase
VTAEGSAIYESRAIAKYLASRYGFTHLLPPATDLEATARFDQAQCVEMCYFSDHAGRVSFEKFVKPLFGGTTDEQAVAEAVKKLEYHFDICDGQLGKPGQEYMAGPTFSLVDIYYIPLVARLLDCGYGDIIMSRENVKNWWSRCTARPAIAKFLEERLKPDDIKKRLEARKAAS